MSEGQRQRRRGRKVRTTAIIVGKSGIVKEKTLRSSAWDVREAVHDNREDREQGQ